MLISEKKFQDACERIRRRRDEVSRIREDERTFSHRNYGLEQGLSQALAILEDVVQDDPPLDPVVLAVLERAAAEGRLKQVRDVFDMLENEQ